MREQWLKPALIAAVGLQLVIMAGVFVNGFYPLWLGEEVHYQHARWNQERSMSNRSETLVVSSLGCYPTSFSGLFIGVKVVQ